MSLVGLGWTRGGGILAARGLDQSIQGIVGVVAAWLDGSVLEIDGLLRVVLDVHDVADRVVGVVQVLHSAWPCRARGVRIAGAVARKSRSATGVEVGEAERLIIVGVASGCAVTERERQL